MRVILIQDAANLRDKLGFWLENTLKAQVHTVSNPPEAIMAMRDGPKVDLVVFDFQKNAIEEYRRFREEAGKTIPIILCLEGVVSDFSQAEANASRTQIVNRRKLIEGVADAIVHLKSKGAMTEESPQTEEVEEGSKLFCRIRTPLLLAVVPLKADIYIKLSKTKFLRLFLAGDEFNQEDHRRYFQQKGIEFLFLKADHVTEFVEKYATQITETLANVNDLRLVGQSEIAVHEITSEMARTIGFTPAVQDLVKTQMKATVQALEKSPDLRGILSKLDNLKGDYLQVHSVLTGHIACGLATEVSWASGLNFHKLTMAAFLHDITLDDGKIAKINTIAEFDKELHGAEAKKAFLEHPIKAAAIADRFTDVPPDVSTIIVQHHERPDQTGFPHKLGAPRMFSMACLFIIAHDMAQFQIENQDKEDPIGLFLEQANKKYESAQFRKILTAVKQCFAEPVKSRR